MLESERARGTSHRPSRYFTGSHSRHGGEICAGYLDGCRIAGQRPQAEFRQGRLQWRAAVNTAIKALREDAQTKASEADAALAKVKQQWRTLTYEVPKLVADLHTQVDTLSSGRGLPKGVTKSSFASAKDGVASLDAMWSDANNTVSSGDYTGAVTKGQAVKDKATELMHTLGMKPS
jgi:hypothetical protein